MPSLIDADALKLRVERYANEPVKTKDRRWGIGCKAIIADMLGLIDMAETIDAEPVRHGRWVKSPEYRYSWKCSECEVLQGFDHITMYYCPRCGAKMDGGDADAD